MKKNELFPVLLLWIACLSSSFAQTHLQNRGAHIHIQAGTEVRVSGDIRNLHASGSDGQFALSGALHLQGDWINHSLLPTVFLPTAETGRLILIGKRQIQNLGGTSATELPHLVLDNPHGVQLLTELILTERLSLWQGKVYAQTFPLIIINPAAGIIDSLSEDRYIVGKLRRYINADTYHLPIGTAQYLESAYLTLHDTQDIGFIEAEFIETSLPAQVGLTNEGVLVSEFLDYGYWRIISPDGGNPQFDLELRSQGHQNGGDDPRQHAIYSRPDQVWENLGIHNNATQSGTGTQAITVARRDLPTFGDFSIGRSDYVLGADSNPEALFSEFSVGNNGGSSDVLYVRFSSQEPSAYTLSLYDYQGKLLSQHMGTASSGINASEIDLATYAHGVYLLQLEREGEIHRMKVW